jgi:hypothetical protein
VTGKTEEKMKVDEAAKVANAYLDKCRETQTPVMAGEYAVRLWDLDPELADNVARSVLMFALEQSALSKIAATGGTDEAEKARDWYPEGLGQQVVDRLMAQWGAGAPQPTVALFTPMVGDGDPRIGVDLINPAGVRKSDTLPPDEVYYEVLGDEYAALIKREQ